MKVLLRLGVYFAPYKRIIACLFAGLVLQSVYEVAVRYSTKMIIDQAIKPGNIAELLFLLGALGAGALIYIGLCVTTDFVWAKYGLLVMNDVRCDVFRRMQTLPMGFFARMQAGDLGARFGADIQRIEDGILYAGPMAAIGLFDLALSLILMQRLNAWLLMLGSAGLAASLLLPRILNKTALKANLAFRIEEGRLGAFVNENIQAQALVKAFCLEPRADADFRRKTGRVMQAGLRSYFLGFLVQRIPNLLFLLSGLAIFGIGAWMAMRQSITLGDLIAFQLLFLGLGQSLNSFAGLLPSLIDAAAGFERIREILDAPATITDRPNAQALVPLASAITFENVSFTPPGRLPSVDHVTLRVAKGEYVAIVGPSGSGKTTLANLLVRLVDPDSGRVAIDGVDIRDVTLASLRARIGIVSQDVVILDMPLIENIRLGRQDASDADVFAAAATAELNDFVASLPEGYATSCGEGGRRLSGGQRQRLSLARALLRNPEILILDEPTAALDPWVEAAIFRSIEPLRGRCTIIAITHRLNIAKKADRILFMSGGRLLEPDQRDELFAVEAVA